MPDAPPTSLSWMSSPKWSQQKTLKADAGDWSVTIEEMPQATDKL